MKKLEVRLRHEPGEERVVGQLAETGSRRAGGILAFEYDPAFLRDPLWLSPFKLPPQPGLVEHWDLELGPLFGGSHGAAHPTLRDRQGRPLLRGGALRS